MQKSLATNPLQVVNTTDLLAKDDTENTKFSVLDMRDTIEDIYEEERKDISFIIANYVYEVYKIYCKYLKVTVQPVEELLPSLTDQTLLQTYENTSFADSEFVELMASTITKSCMDDMKLCAVRLMDHVIEKMGWLKVENRKTL